MTALTATSKGVYRDERGRLWLDLDERGRRVAGGAEHSATSGRRRVAGANRTKLQGTFTMTTTHTRARHLACLLTDYHRFLVVLSAARLGVRGSTEGHLGACVLLEDIREALGEAQTPSNHENEGDES